MSKKTSQTPAKEKILSSAAQLFHQQGVNGTSVDDVLSESGTGKSQFYHYFGSKDSLVRAVVDHHHMRTQHMNESLKKIESFDELLTWWSSSMKEVLSDNEFYGCPVGTMANEMAMNDEELRSSLDTTFDKWIGGFARAFAVLRAKGELVNESDPDELAEFMVASFQGASLIAKTKQDRQVLFRCMTNCLNYLQSFRVKS